ncbi:MAG: substrate-binding domain-containing protein [Desulfovibrio sp.]|nr:substrate-binding domain-containing protein [Desulfovibrio sp.]
MCNKQESRRIFLKGVVGACAASALIPTSAQAQENKSLQVWSCGGLAEAMHPAHLAFEAETGVHIYYTGAFAGVLGKSLLAGTSETDVFCGRVLALAKNLRKAGRMRNFKPLCFTSYLIAVPKGNPKKITCLEDLTKPGVRVAMAPNASPPGGQAVMGILKAANLQKEVMKNVLDKQASCIQRTVTEVCSGNADAMIVERRITRMDRFAPFLDFVEIPEKFFPQGPLTFTIGIMQNCTNQELAEQYRTWMLSQKGQKFFEQAGFISSISPEGQALITKLGVYDD